MQEPLIANTGLSATTDSEELTTTGKVTENKAQLKISLTRGSATVVPANASSNIIVSGTFTLYKGDQIIIHPSSTGTFSYGRNKTIEIEENTSYQVTQNSLHNINSKKELLVFDNTHSEQAVLKQAVSEIAGGNVTPVEGLTFSKNRGWKEFVKIPHRSSFTYGATLKCGNNSKFQISTSDGRTLRVLGPASVTINKDSIIINSGLALVQSKHKNKAITFETNEAKMELKGTLLIINRILAPDTTNIKLINGILSLQSQPSWKGTPWSIYLSAHREISIVKGANPPKPKRFSSADLLSPFIEGWQTDKDNTTWTQEFESNELLMQLRADQAKAQRPPEIKDTETNSSETNYSSGNSQRNSTGNTTDWMRLRMKSTDNPVRRRHYVTFQRYANARTARERYEEEIRSNGDFVENLIHQDAEAKSHIPGGKTRTGKDAKLRLLVWLEKRLATQLSKIEDEFMHQDFARGHRPDSILYSKKRSVRERLYGEDLRMQSRRLISEALVSLNVMSTRVEDINTELAGIPDTPANQNRINALKAERTSILTEADKLTDSVRAVIRLH